MDKADQRDFDSHYEYWDKIKGVNGGEMKEGYDLWKEMFASARREQKRNTRLLFQWLDKAYGEEK
jgi:hypothetical protein